MSAGTVPTVGVVGGGASGTIAASQLARTATRLGLRLQVLLVEPGEPGRGVAYSTRDSEHRLNVPAGRMSAWQHDPDHFLRWLHNTVAPQFPAGGFAPRPWYALYLRAVLDEAFAEATDVTLRQLRTRVTSIRRDGAGYRLALASGTTVTVDALVLANGHAAPDIGWAPDALVRSSRFVADPWQTALPVLPRDATALLVGSGLTMADVAKAVGRDGAQLHVVSRHGLLPLPHARTAAEPAAAPELPPGARLDVATLRRLLFAHVRSLDGDWRRAADSLRPVTAALWAGLPVDERARFLVTSVRRWDRLRHRVDADTGDWLAARLLADTLRSHAGSVVAAVETSDRVEVRLSSGASITADLVVNCTGPADVAQGGDPLITQLLSDGLARPGPLRLGLATLDDGRVLPAHSGPVRIWTLGVLRRGQLWESTAIPEIRAQAAVLARSITGALLPFRAAVPSSA